METRRGGMMRFFYICLAAVLATLLARGQETASVTVTAESVLSYDDAVSKALREAVRQVAGVLLDSQTRVADFVLVRDTIYSRAAGYVRSHTILERSRGADDTFIVKISAEVARGRIESDCLAIRNLIEHLGRPEFVVTVEERSGGERGVGVWVEGALNDWLEGTGMGVLHRKTAAQAEDRQYMRAVAAGDTKKAGQLKLRMGAPYGVDVTAFGRTERQTLFDARVEYPVVELQVSVVHRDSGALLASKSVRGGRPNVPSLQLAAKHAVEIVFPEMLDRILAHWSEDLDVGAAISIQVYNAGMEIGADLVKALAGIDGISKAEKVEWPENGIGVIRVIGRVKATELADRIGELSRGRLRGHMEGPRVITARPVAEVTKGGRRPPGGESGGEAVRDDRSSGLIVPAAIIGGCVLVGLVLLAFILRKR